MNFLKNFFVIAFLVVYITLVNVHEADCVRGFIRSLSGQNRGSNSVADISSGDDDDDVDTSNRYLIWRNPRGGCLTGIQSVFGSNAVSQVNSQSLDVYAASSLNSGIMKLLRELSTSRIARSGDRFAIGYGEHLKEHISFARVKNLDDFCGESHYGGGCKSEIRRNGFSRSKIIRNGRRVIEIENSLNYGGDSEATRGYIRHIISTASNSPGALSGYQYCCTEAYDL